jgi:rod shape-determining protein MreC
VDAVTATASRVQLITDPGASINVHLQSSNTDILMTGSITGDVSLNLIPQDLMVNPNDLILTSGLGGAYPAEVVVGQVVGIRKRETDLFQTATIQPIVNFSSLKAVLIITNFHPVDVSPLIPAPGP